MNYRTSRAVRRLFLAAFLVVLGFAAFWAGLITVATRASKAVQELTINNIDFDLAASLLVSMSYKAVQIVWESHVLAQIAVAAGFGLICLVAGRFHRSRLAVAVVAASFFLVFAGGAAPRIAIAFYDSATDGSYENVMGKAGTSEVESSAGIPLGPYIPLPSIGAAHAADEAEPRRLTDAEISDIEEEAFDLFALLAGWMVVLLSSRYALLLAFWAVLGGLIGSLFVGFRIHKEGDGAEPSPM